MKKALLDWIPERKNVIVRELSDECLAYDAETHQAHCLSRTAADVWKLCDGKMRVAEIVRSMMKDSRPAVDEDVVLVALFRLQKCGLLRKPSRGHEQILLSRRALVRKMGIAAALAVPVVTTLLVPTAAQAASCLHAGRLCTLNSQCCSGSCFGVPLRCVGG